MVALMAETEEELLEGLREHGLTPVKAPVRRESPRKVDLDPHQIKAVEELSSGKILLGGVGTGKSRTAVAYYVQKELPRDVVVITTAKKRDSFDWEEEFLRFGVGTEKDASLTGTTYRVDSWNNIDKYTDAYDTFFIFDEQKLVGSGAWSKSFLKIAKRNNSWILLSATPGDVWMDYVPVFVANGFYKNRTEFKREHVIYNNYSKFPKVDRYIGVNKLTRLRREILVQMPYQRHTTRKIHHVLTDHNQELLKKAMIDRWHVYEERPIRDVAELFGVMRKVVNSDPSRIEAVREKLQEHDKVIVFYNFDYELESLRKLGQEMENEQSCLNVTTDTSSPSQHCGQTTSSRKTTPGGDVTGVEKSSPMTISSDDGSSMTPSRESGRRFQMAEWNGHRHEPIPKSDRWMYLVQYIAGAEGWNCIETDTTLFHSLTYSYKNFEQAKGRIDRLNTPFTDLNYYILHSNSDIDRAILKNLKQKQNFNESSMGIKF